MARLGKFFYISVAPTFDPDAQAFFDRVTTAGGTLSTTEKNATNQLVLDMKSAGIWSSMKAIYPMVGASVNLMSYTENFSNAYWSKSGATITVNNITAPDGTMTADRVVYSTTNNYVYAVSALSGGIGTQSFYVKGTLGETLHADDGYTAASLITLTGDWQRVTFTTTRPLGQLHGILIGTFSGATARTIWLWGAQVDKAATATTYTPVLGSRTTEAAAACAQNLKSSSFTGSFSSGWTFASTGVTPNGTSAYMDTGLNALSNLTLTSTHLSAYVRNNTLGSQYDLGCSADISAYSNATALITRYFNNTSYIEIGGGGYGTSTSMSNSQGFTFGTTNGSRVQNLYKNGTLIVSSSSNANNFANKNVYLGAINGGGTPTFFSDKQYALCSIGDGLDATQQSNFYTAVQTFNQTLNRQVGAQIVSDADAQAYINRVYTAGGTLTNTEANAVNQLTIDMKAAGIWTAMKAVYPMVGSSAAACAQNLKSSSFTGSFSSGWTFASTGVTPNGTSAYMNTGFNPNTQLTFTNAHASLYKNLGTISAIDKANGVYDVGGNAIDFSLNPDRSTSLYSQGAIGSYSPNTGVGSSSLVQGNGFYVIARNANNFVRLTKNNTNTLTNTTTSSPAAYPNDNVWLGAAHQVGLTVLVSPNNYRYAFMSLGDYLDATQASNFYTAVQAFQTTLSRQV